MYAIGVRSNTYRLGALSGGLFLYNDRSNEQWTRDVLLPQVCGRYFVPLAFGISDVDLPISADTYQGRTYITGGYTYNLILDEHHRLWKQGMRAPAAPPDISGASGTGYVAYLSWYDETTGERSTLTAGTAISSAVPRTWTLPARPPDEVFESDGNVTATGLGSPTLTADSDVAQLHWARPGDRITHDSGDTYHLVDQIGWSAPYPAIAVDLTGLEPIGNGPVHLLPVTRATHIELWLSVAGGLPSLVLRAPVGTTTVVESTDPGSLGETFSGSFERFPRCTINCIWNDRQVMSGDPDNPDTVYLSTLFFPERYEGLNFRTRNGDPVTGLLAVKDILLVFTRNRTYALTGYTTDDFTLIPVEYNLGSVGHNCNVSIHGNGYVWTAKGPYLWNGSWHPLSPENEFRMFTPLGNIPRKPTISRSRAVVDPDSNTYAVVVSDDYWMQTSEIGLFDRYINYGPSDTTTAWDKLMMVADGGGDKQYPPLQKSYVFDYTTIQPEVGGALTSARMSVDINLVPHVARTGDSSNVQWGYHYLANKWGFGRLYTITEIVPTGEETIGAYSFYIHPHFRLTERYLGEGNVFPAGGYGSPGFEAPYADFIKFIVMCGHNYFDQVGGSDMDGKSFYSLWFEFRHYLDPSTARLQLTTGDDDALEIELTKNYSATVLDLTTLPVYDLTTGPLIHQITPDGLTGRGLAFILSFPNLGKGASFKGYGGYFIQGPATRYGKREILPI